MTLSLTLCEWSSKARTQGCEHLFSMCVTLNFLDDTVVKLSSRSALYLIRPRGNNQRVATISKYASQQKSDSWLLLFKKLILFDSVGPTLMKLLYREGPLMIYLIPNLLSSLKANEFRKPVIMCLLLLVFRLSKPRQHGALQFCIVLYVAKLWTKHCSRVVCCTAAIKLLLLYMLWHCTLPTAVVTT